MKPALSTLALVLLAAAGPAAAETLADAWEAALSAHGQVAAAADRRAAADFELEAARAARWPTVGVTSAYTRIDTAPGFELGPGLTTGPLFDGDDFVSAGAQLSLPLYAGGAISAGIDAAESGAAAAASQFDAVVDDVRLSVAEHYVAVLRAESAVQVAQSIVASLTTHTEDTKNRMEFGAVPQNEYLAASVSLANAQQRLLQAENGLEFSRAAYNRMLGRPLMTPVALDPALAIDGLVPAGAGLEELIGAARSGRKELLALDAQSAALRNRADAARAEARPQVALTGGYMMLENEFLTDDRFWMAGLNLKWNLFDAGGSRKRSAALERQASAVFHTRADLESTIELQVRRAWNDRIEARNRLGVAESAVEQATENLRVVRNRYVAGASTNVEVLDAEALREQSLSNRDDARYEVALATLRLTRAAGRL